MKTNKKTDKKTNAKKAAKTPEAKKPYGIKAYGKWTRFATRDEYEHYLNDWIAGTDGHEQDRAIKALSDLLVGKKTTDTDKMPEAVPVPKPEAKPEPKPEAKPLTDEEKRAKRNEYAREYYKAHREVLKERSRLCHAKRRAADKAAKLEAEKKAAKKPSKKASKKGAKNA